MDRRPSPAFNDVRDTFSRQRPTADPGRLLRCRIDDRDLPHVLITALADVESPLAQGTLDVAADRFRGNDEETINGATSAASPEWNAAGRGTGRYSPRRR